MILAYDIEAYLKDSETYTAVIAIFIFFGWAIIPFTYVLGFIF